MKSERTYPSAFNIFSQNIPVSLSPE